MVCTKLKKGTCTLSKKKCGKKYHIKMQKHKECAVFKKGKGVKAKKIGKKAAKKIVKSKKKAIKKKR